MGEKVTSKTRISYEVERDFCEVRVQKERILVRVFNTGMRDPKGVINDIPKSHGWQFEKEIPIDSEQLVDYAIPFVGGGAVSPGRDIGVPLARIIVSVITG
jgi:predicted transport protein